MPCIEEFFAVAKVKMLLTVSTFKKAAWVKKIKVEQRSLLE
jgi:hypothetical protein